MSVLKKPENIAQHANLTGSSRLMAGVNIYQTCLRHLDEHKDERGSFTEIFQDFWGLCIKPTQWSCVKSEERTVRGMHIHTRHDEYFSVLSGHVLLGLKDIRQGSPTENEFGLYELHSSDMAALAFPRGLLHGWYFLEKTMHVQAVSESYVDYSKDDNWGCRWNAEDLGIPWPFESAIMSDRAAGFGSVAELKTSLGARLSGLVEPDA